MKYTKEILENAVKNCISVAGVVRSLGLAEAGGTHSHISRLIKKFQLDTSHFLPRGIHLGEHKGGSQKQPWQEVLRLRTSGRRQKVLRLRRAMIDSGREYRCEAEGCSVKGEWLSKLISLEVNHKNGNWLDDRPENVEFSCPNCHSQTANYCGKKGVMEPKDLISCAKHSKAYRLRQQMKKKQQQNLL
jgi:hypothetical protein